MGKYIQYIRVKFEGIYGWGCGFYSPEQSLAWERYWRNIKNISWQYVPSYDDSCGRLVSLDGTIYLHPMGFDTVLHSSGGTCCGKHFFKEAETLLGLCKGAAEACGGTCTMEASDEIEVNFETHEINEIA